MDILNSADRLIQDYIRPYAWPLVFIAFLTIISLGQFAFNILLAGDEWAIILNPLGQSNWAVSIGRWGNRVLWDLLPFRDFNPSYLILGNALFIVGAALWASQIIGFRSVWATTLFLGFFILSPVWVESYFFTLGQFSRVFIMFFAMTQVWATLRFCEAEKFKTHLWPYGAIAVATFVLVASFYQAHVIWSLEIFGVAVLMRIVTNPEKFPTAILWKRYFPRSIGVFITGLIIYTLSVSFFQWFYGVEPTQLESYSASKLVGTFGTGLVEQIEYIGRVLLQFYFFDMHMVPAIFGWAILAGVGVYIVDFWQNARDLHERKKSRSVFVLALLTAVLVLPFLFGLLRELRLTMIIPSSVLFSFFIAYPLERLKPGILRSMFAIIGFFLLFLSGYQLSSGATAKQLNNNLDMYMVTSLVEQLSHEPRIAKMPENKKLTINLVGRPSYGSGAPFAVGVSDGPLGNSITNCGIFNCQGKRLKNAAVLVGYKRKIEVKQLSEKRAWQWLNNHLSKQELAALPKHPLKRWQINPDTGLIVGKGPEVLLLLRDLRPLKKVNQQKTK